MLIGAIDIGGSKTISAIISPKGKILAKNLGQPEPYLILAPTGLTL